MKFRVVGLTGSIGTGKSTVAAILQKLGATVIDADKVAHDIYAQDTKLRQSLVKRFGDAILSSTGIVDRKKLSVAAFGTKGGIAALERITHPAIIKVVKKRIGLLKGLPQLCVVEASLLFESGFESFCDVVVLVSAQFEQVACRAKASKRFSAAELKQRNERQLPLSAKLERSDFLIDNGGSLAETRRQVKLLYDCLTNGKN
jgi:dephospho-CoA kinase